MTAAAGPQLARILDPLPLANNDAELRRRLGYPADGASRTWPAPVEEALLAGRPHLAPRGVFALYPVGRSSSRGIELDGHWLAGRIGEFFAGAARVAVFVATVGAEISELARAAAARGDSLASFTLDALGSWATEAAADALMLAIEAQLQPGEALSQRHSPGYCSMSLATQQNLFALIDAAAVGVSLNPALMMTPLKSVSGLVALGPETNWAASLSPCATCEDLACPARR